MDLPPDLVLSTRSILKAQPSPTGNQTVSPSWLSRIQSKLYSPDDDVPVLPKRELKRVTFSVSRLTTERIFCNSDDDAFMLANTCDEDYPMSPCSDDQQDEQVDENDIMVRCRELPKYYERACRLREEQPLDRFMEILRSSCFSQQLTVVDLSNQPIDSRQMGPIADILMMDCCRTLSRLDLSNCGLDDASLRILLHGLLLNDRLPELNLAHNPFKADGFKYIAIYISQSQSIGTLDLSYTSPDKRALRYLSRALELAPALQRLYMDHCALKANLVEVLAGGVRRSRSLLHLSLRHNRISQKTDMWIVHMLSISQSGYDDGNNDDADDDLSDNWSETRRIGLQQLDLTGNYLQGVVASVAKALHSNRTLTHLILADCQIYPAECAMLAEALLSNHHLRVLNLADNPLGARSDEGIIALKGALSKNHFLQELNLAGTGLESGAAIALAECLPENTTLQRLDLTRNLDIGMAGVLALAVSIKMNTTLTFLDINIPPNDSDMAHLQHGIVAACTENMQRSLEDTLYAHEGDSMNEEASSSSSVSSPRPHELEISGGAAAGDYAASIKRPESAGGTQSDLSIVSSSPS